MRSAEECLCFAVKRVLNDRQGLPIYRGITRLALVWYSPARYIVQYCMHYWTYQLLFATPFRVVNKVNNAGGYSCVVSAARFAIEGYGELGSDEKQKAGCVCSE